MNNLIVFEGDFPALDQEIEWNLIRYKHMADDAEEAYKDLMARLKKAMEEAGIIRIETDRVVLTLSNPADKEVFDVKRFRDEHPDLYDEYVYMKEQKSILKPTFRNYEAYEDAKE